MSDKRNMSDNNKFIKELISSCSGNCFSVPEGYFDQSYERIAKRCADVQGLQGAFQVPKGYFDSLSDRIALKIADEQSELRDSANGFDVPQGYFDTLSDRIALSVVEERLKSQVSTAGFEVPKGYFEDLERRTMLAAEVVNQEDTVVVRKLQSRNWLRYAVAACAVFLLGVSAYLMVSDRNAAKEQVFLANVSDQELVDYLRFYSESNDLIYITEHVQQLPERAIDSDLSIDDIEYYLSNTL